jgi:hypothetical protein
MVRVPHLGLGVVMWVVGLSAPQQAHAAPLTLYDLDSMPFAVRCHTECALGPVSLLEECQAGCAPIDAEWEKDGQAPVSETDFHLAVLEYWDDSDGTAICYDNDTVVPAPLCGSANCESAHPGLCHDADGDGFAAWQEAQAGTDDTVANESCGVGDACSFLTRCEFVFAFGAQACVDRQCVDSDSCTAFHLEEVAESNQELIVYVHFDYAPVPPTVLDLRLMYSADDLRLVDARPLPPLLAQEKEVAITHPRAGVLRLVVLGTGSASAIPSGAIIELVFQRTSPLDSHIEFDAVDYYQKNSMAPDQGMAQAELANDALWGNNIEIAAANPTGRRLVLSYAFDNPLAPLDYNGAPSAEALCPLLGPRVCPLSPEDSPEQKLKATTIAKLVALQSGVTQTSQRVQGISSTGAYLDGSSDHLALPVMLNTPYLAESQDFSLSMWVYSEGKQKNDLESEQLLFSHNKMDERTRFGLLLEPVNDEFGRLVWFQGEYPGHKNPLVVAEDLPLFTWTHIAMTVAAKTGDMQFFVNGELATSTRFNDGTPTIACPQLGSGDHPTEPPVVLREEGANGLSPETLFFASSNNGLFGIDRMEPSGLSRRELIRSTDAIHQDPDYSPITGKLVYSSNASGNFEIWLADGNGASASREQISVGFGDTGRGVFARRPRWAPDGSGIIFESNVYDAEAPDNIKRVYHLYYVAYDAAENEVAIPLESGGTTTQLDYEMLVRSQTVSSYRVTNLDQNHNQVIWLRGSFSEADTSGTTMGYLGDILFNVADERFHGQRIHRARIPTLLTSSSSGEARTFGSLKGPHDLRALDGFHVNTSGKVKSQLLFERSYRTLEDAALFAATSSLDDDGNTVVSITRNSAATDVFEIRELYLAYDTSAVAADLDSEISGPGAGIGENADAGQVTKEVKLRDVFDGADAYVRIEVLSPTNNDFISTGAEVARILLRPVSEQDPNNPYDPGIQLFDANVYQEHYIEDLTSSNEPLQLSMTSLPLHQVSAAVFSPEGGRLLFAGIAAARPVLVTAKLSAADAEYGLEEIRTVSTLPMAVEGLSWKREERFYPCNWVGGYRDPHDKLFAAGLRGGLDEVKLYSYVREALAFRSDAQRGFERLRAEGRELTVEPLVPPCSGLDSECPLYYQCIDSQCQMVACDPADANPCADSGGRCTLRPTVVEADGTVYDWVCITDCNTDNECLRQECLNGPCRLCEAGTCIECQEQTKDYGGFELTYIEGCPDRNSFACEAGSCVTECYSFANGESRYLCDEALEYCHLGRCEVFEWKWWEISPASLSGMGEMQFDLSRQSYSIAKPQLYPIEIEAYGVGDYLHPPEIFVEGKVTTEGAQVFGGDWFIIGRVLVHNETEREMKQSEPYVLYTPHPVTNLRLRLVTPPFENLNAASTGLSRRDKSFCYAQAEAWAAQTGTAVDYTPCFRRASGSRFTLGYEAAIPSWRVYQSCDEEDLIDCRGNLNDDPFRGYLQGGQPAVVITDLKINGTGALNGIEKNLVCSYEGTTKPLKTDGSPKKLFFGDISAEQSNQKDLYCSQNACNSSTLVSMLEVTGKGWALLNCNFMNPTDEGNDGAVIEVTAPKIIAAAGFVGYENVTEYSDSGTCLFEPEPQAPHKPCFDYTGGDATFDYLSAPSTLYHTLDIDMFRGFAYENELVTIETTP